MSSGTARADTGSDQHAVRLITTRRVSQVVAYVTLVIAAIIFMIPVLWLLISSLKAEGEYVAYPVTLLPKIPQFANYYRALTIIPFFTYFGHSLFLASAYTVLVQATSALAAFAFARIPARGKGTLFKLIVATMMVPGIVTVIPQFMVFSQVGLTGTWWPWILWGLASQPFHIFLYRQFFLSIPVELEEAAEMDGCGTFRIFWQIFIPNSLGAIAASSIFSFQWVWGDWFYPAIFLKDENTTLAVKLATGYVDPLGHRLVTPSMAAVAIYVLPLIVVFFLAQKHIVQGIVTTGIKG
jgi:multiple sugar transport system permease protein